jgi:hypothetical protein
MLPGELWSDARRNAGFHEVKWACHPCRLEAEQRRLAWRALNICIFETGRGEHITTRKLGKWRVRERLLMLHRSCWNCCSNQKNGKEESSGWDFGRSWRFSDSKKSVIVVLWCGGNLRQAPLLWLLLGSSVHFFTTSASAVVEMCLLPESSGCNPGYRGC